MQQIERCYGEFFVFLKITKKCGTFRPKSGTMGESGTDCISHSKSVVFTPVYDVFLPSSAPMPTWTP